MNAAAKPSRFRLGEWLIAPQECRIDGAGASQSIEPKLMDVLVFLCERAGEVVSAEELLIALWRGSFYGDNPVHKSIAQLRRILGDSATQPRYIATIRKRGYRVTAPVTFMDDYAAAPTHIATWTEGNPYPGLAAFDADRRAVFYGRSQAQAAVLSRLQSRLAENRGFVLILGPSGSGKTSLLQAGVVPLLTQAHGFDGTQALAVARIEPTHVAADPFAALAEAMLQWRIGGEPLFHETEREWIATSLLQDPPTLFASLDDRLLRRADFQAAEQRRPVLLLVLDQMERTFAQKDDAVAALGTLFGCLANLLATGHVAALAACRNDFYPNLVRVPALVNLKAEDGQFDLAPLSSGEVAQIIRVPAQAAGLSFEQDRETGLRLDDILRDAAAQHPQSLPLLQHTLSVLYEKRTATGMLTLAAYHEVGGLAGSLARHAEQAFAQLTDASQRHLPELLRRMVSIEEDDRSPVGQPVLWSQIDDADTQALVRGLVDQRLFTSVLLGDAPAFAVAHESLFNQWPRIQQWITENQRLLLVRARVAQAQRRWSSEGERQDFLLPAGSQLDDASRLASGSALSLSPEQRRFIDASRRRARRQHGARAAALGAIVVLGVVAGVAGIVAMIQRRAAVEQRSQAESLVGFMLGKLTDSLRPLGKLDVLDSVGNEAMKYLASVPPESSNLPVNLMRERALRQIGEIRLARGDIKGAAESFERAAALSQSLTTEYPNNTDAWFDYGNAVFWLGQLAYSKSDYEEATANWNRYLQAAQKQVDLKPDDPKSVIELSYAHTNLATLDYRRSHYDDAQKGFHASLELKRRAHKLDPDNTDILVQTANTLTWLGSVDEAQGMLADAERQHASAVDALVEARKKNPDDQPLRYREAIARMHVALSALSLGEVDSSADQYRAAYEELQSLQQVDLKNLSWRHDGITAGLYLGWIEYLRGHVGPAKELITKNADACDEMIRRTPSSSKFLLLHSFAIWIRQRTDIGPVAGSVLAEEISAIRALVDKSPADASARKTLADLLIARALDSYEKNTGNAAADADEVLKILSLPSPTNTQTEIGVLNLQAAAYFLAGRKSEALAIVDRLDSLGYRHPAYLKLLRFFHSETSNERKQNDQ
ncbi:MAG: winged helix-turn-helix domain-containing protein [Rudaea sp.]|uniref:nSTAND1 domain-containing NTPase n=1 Tax=unclassified Rudaea TaxID=2627037 RepID=UPI0010F98BDE|nr:MULTISPECIES: winged helix-turn-helix domain-containing protein [unclassified Rudaea]MBN8887745.1 winged helix-turn-helix domain-containing protein [Rudaea sp.]